MTGLGLVGMGHAGLPMAILFDRCGHRVVGYDIDEAKIDHLQSDVDPLGHLGDDTIRQRDVTYTTDPASLSECEYIIVAVPTPLADDRTPELGPLKSAGETIGRHIRPGTTVVLESTVFPGATRSEFLPAIERTSSLTVDEEFFIGYSPERVVPGDQSQQLREITKLVGASSDSTLQDLVELYETVFDKVEPTPTIETAEAAKCLENTQRDVNIAVINEFAMACEQIESLDYREVLDAAATKWNFHQYEPGFVDGHCLPVDPYYLSHAFEEQGFSTELIRTARHVNESVATHVAQVTLQALERRRQLRASVATVPDGGSTSNDGQREESVLVAGVAYKPDTGDVRSPSIRRLVRELEDTGYDVVGTDPNVSAESIRQTFDIPAQTELSAAGFDGLVVPTGHSEFAEFNLEDVCEEMAENPVVVDVDGAFEPTEQTDETCIYRGI